MAEWIRSSRIGCDLAMPDSSVLLAIWQQLSLTNCSTLYLLDHKQPVHGQQHHHHHLPLPLPLLLLLSLFIIINMIGIVAIVLVVVSLMHNNMRTDKHQYKSTKTQNIKRTQCYEEEPRGHIYIYIPTRI